MKKELKKQIKQDEFRSGLETGFGWLWGHRDELKFGAIVAVLVVGGLWGLNEYRKQRAQEAEKAFAEAIALFEAPLSSELPEGVPPPGGRVFETRAEKYTKAVAAFDGVERQQGSSLVGVRASYYAALCRAELGELEEAEEALQAIAARTDLKGLEPVLARLAIAGIQHRAGKLEEAVDSYRRLAEDPASALPRDHALMELGSLLEELDQGVEARASYRRLSEEFPESVYAAEAQRRADYLRLSAEG